MLKSGRVTKVKVFFPVLVHVFNIDLFEFSAAILEKGLFFQFLFSKSWAPHAILMIQRTNLVPRAHVPFGQHQDTECLGAD